MLPSRSAQFVAAILGIVAFPAAVFGQTAQLTGQISDATSALLPDAMVTVTNTATGIDREVISDQRGYYTVSFITPGTYRITVQRRGFRPATRDALTLSMNETARVDFELQIAAVQEDVRVDAMTSPVQRGTSSLGQVVADATIASLPVLGRNYMQLVLLSPGTGPHVSSRVRTDGATLNGNRALQNAYLLDGLDNGNHLFGLGTGSTQTIRPSLDAIQEFRVETAGYGAEHGRAAGGLISVITKSGTNALRGSGFEFLGHDRLEANDFFAKRAGLVKPPLRYHQFGGTVGGPILQNRAFFFGSYQGTRERRTYTATVTVPTPSMVRGEFSDVPIYDPLNIVNGVRQPFANNTIPATRLDPVGQRVASLFPAPNRAGIVENFVGTVPRTDDRDQIDSRVDYRVTDRSHLFVRYSRSTGGLRQESLFGPPGNGNPNVSLLGGERLGFPRSSAVHGWSTVLGQTQMFSNAVVNELRAGFSANRYDLAPLAGRPLIEDLGLNGIPLVPELTGLPFFDITGHGALGEPTMSPSHQTARILHVADNLSWARGAHTLKLGGEVRLKTNGVTNLQLSRGEFTFTGQFTSRVPGQGSGSGLADLLLGQTTSARLSTPIGGNIIDRYAAAYISDSWKLASSLTLNLGLRYEVQTPMWERDNRMTNFDAEPGNATYGALVPARPGDVRSRSFSQVDRDNFAPRVGMAWQLSPTTAVRSAYGMFYGNLGFQAAVLSPLANAPYFVRVAMRSVPGASSSTLVLRDGFPADVLNPTKASNPDAFAVAPDFPLGKVHQWHLSVERAVWSHMALTATYIGSDSSELRGLNNVNAPVPGPGPVQTRRPFPAFGDILAAGNFVQASYHALQLSAERRLTDGVALISNYTWSHAIDNSTDVSDTQTIFVPQNPNDIRAERASASFDVRHRAVASVIYESPIGRQRTGVDDSRTARLLLGGWRLAGVLVAQSGYPLTPTLIANSSVSTTPLRPDCVRDGNLPRGERTVERWFDVSAFEVPPPFTFGNCGRNVLRAPGFVNVDLLVAREFRVGGDKRLEFRAEVFNVANAAHLGPPNTVVNLPALAGRITSTLAPARHAHLAVRFVF